MAPVRPGEEAPFVSDTTTCPSCSATLPAGAAFCTTCGTRLGGAPEPAADA
ncbi:MAG: zinc ribbon domain-containing protein, partial [Actinobacteria bacterium]|nr:zinc ribbon domain-containing protein [Actinomycetota bacterium]